MQIHFAPIATLQECSIAEANELLQAWGHKMGPLNRALHGEPGAHVLLHESRPVAITTTSTLVREGVGGGLRDLLTRENTLELSRLCAATPALNRAMLRLWRELVFPKFGLPYTISYQDSDLHNGNTYRFDGWLRMAHEKSHGVDQRSGRRGRNKWIWGWPRTDLLALGIKEAA